jgi:LacI family transcriptional regulator
LINISRRSIDREKAALENFLRLGVDGIIAAPNENCAEYYRDLDVPVVFFDTFISGLKVPYVGTDDLKGACDAVELLVSLGHKKIAYIGARNDLTASQRIQGYKEVMNKHGLELNSDYILEKEYSRQWGYNGADVLFKLETPPTALFCGNDTIASGVLAYMSNRGLRCPEHLSIAGFGNLGLSEGLGLTTVSQSCHDISNSVWSAMLTLINGDSAIQQTILPTSLIVRQSTAMLIN